MANYKDSFQIKSESLSEGGHGILTAVENKDTHTERTAAPPPRFDQPQDDNRVPRIRTLADDLHSAVEKENVSLASQALTPHKREVVNDKETKPKKSKRTSKKTQTPLKPRRLPPALLIVFLGILLIFGGSIYVFTSKHEISFGSFTPSLPKISLSFKNPFAKKGGVDKISEKKKDLPPALIRIDDFYKINGPQTQRSFIVEIDTLKNRADTGAIAFSISQSSATNKDRKEEGVEPLSLFEILNLIGAQNTPLVLNIKDHTLGTIKMSEAKESELFLIAKVRSYDNAFGYMLQWEKEMPLQLYRSFHNVDGAIFNANDTFRDVMVENVHARELLFTPNSESEEALPAKPVLIYSFPKKDTVILTSSREALIELTSRLK